jgi:hypothetical protein
MLTVDIDEVQPGSDKLDDAGGGEGHMQTANAGTVPGSFLDDVTLEHGYFLDSGSRRWQGL